MSWLESDSPIFVACVVRQVGEGGYFYSVDWQLSVASWFMVFCNDYILSSLYSFDRDWKKIEAFIGSKTVIQVTSCTSTY